LPILKGEDLKRKRFKLLLTRLSDKIEDALYHGLSHRLVPSRDSSQPPNSMTDVR